MKTLKLRILDKHVPKLGQVASVCNYVWNYVNALGFTHLQRTGKFFGAYDIAPYTKGAGELLGLHSQTIQAKNPLKCNLGFGISTTALFFPIIAIEPLSLYLKASRGLFRNILTKFLAKFFPC